jgi:hypothetical protein
MEKGEMDMDANELTSKLMKKALYDKYPLIPSYMYEGIINYVVHHIKPGHFLSAVIQNDLKEAVASTDNENQEAIVSYVKFFYNDTPGDCWGSKQNYNEWLGIEEDE